ncbi:ubiquitin carboxyl-terminal hydrolase 16-like isoform X2 [Abrus precatorius]|uniref:ubiquitinyl hydrolase 1 n=1 Tax=Abrus precatorius TaxID=3816 RepID=A0A8B8LI65_ABRPR|nr:ubiquitin carboxyl-terminal hydrolase 16-like isoform X2 [Abrus precatorius]
MRVTGDLGFSSLILVVVCVVLPVIGFLIRRKWRLSVARKEEIKRLLILAAEETAKAEREASYVYVTPVTAAASNQCAVCHFPATARCAQCKSVRYCSFECQTVHWRQGHKLECRPPSTTHRSDDVSSEVVEQDYSGIHGEKSKSDSTECKTTSEKTPISDTSFSPKVSLEKDENIRVESLAEVNITDSNSELSSNSFSGFSASTNSSDSSDDSSVCESIISNEHDRPEGHIFVDPTLDIPDNTSGDNNMGVAMSSSPKFAILVDSVDGFSTMHKFNHDRPGFSKEERKLAPNATSGSSMWKGKTIEPSREFSGFWDKTLDSRGIGEDAKSDTHPSHSDESMAKKADSGSSFHFSFSSNMLPLHVQDTKAKDSVLDNAFPNCVGDNMPCPGSASSENDSMNSSKVRNFSFINSRVSNVMNHGTPSGSESDQLESKDSSGPHLSSFSPHSSSVGKDSGCADALSIHNLQSVGSVVSNHIVDKCGSTLKSTKIRCLTRELSDSNLASGTEEHSHSSTKCGNNGIESSTRTATSSQVSSCSANSKSGLKTSVLKVVDQFRGSNLSKHFPLAVGNDITGRYNDKGLFPYELFVKLYNLNKVEFCPFGLINCGNSCYANAVLQCLAFTPPLTAYLLQGLHSKSCVNKKWCFTCEFESLILKSKGTKSSVSPLGIISHLQNIGSQLGNGREEDAHEFLRHVIDTMQSVCLMEAGANASGSSEEDTTLMGLTFGGYIRSKIKCMKCGGKSERQERIMDLTVEIEGEITTLVEALRRFTSTETLDGENKYHCVRCKSYEKAKKKLTVSEAPNVLTVALKRFQSGKFGKLNKPIQFPEILDLAPFMSGTSDKSPIYRLYGVVVHLDIMNAAFSGHYVCYVKNIQNKWFKVDDSVVTAVELERVLTKGAYMLFYARCSPRAPRLIRNRIISPDSKSKVSGKTLTTKARYISTNSGTAEHVNSLISPDGSPALETFYSKFHHLKRILEEDSSSDNSSLISSNSDEGSCSTDSTRDSTSTDDFSDYIFGDSGNGWSSMWRNSDSDSSSSSSSSPLNSRHSPLSDMDRYDSVSPDGSGLRIPTVLSPVIDDPLYRNRLADVERREIVVSRLHTDPTLQNRKLDSDRISSNSSSSSSSSSRETDPFLKLGSNHFNDIGSGVSRRKSRKRTD